MKSRQSVNTATKSYSHHRGKSAKSATGMESGKVGIVNLKGSKSKGYILSIDDGKDFQDIQIKHEELVEIEKLIVKKLK